MNRYSKVVALAFVVGVAFTVNAYADGAAGTTTASLVDRIGAVVSGIVGFLTSPLFMGVLSAVFGVEVGGRAVRTYLPWSQLFYIRDFLIAMAGWADKLGHALNGFGQNSVDPVNPAPIQKLIRKRT